MPLTGNLHFHSDKDNKVLSEFESLAKNYKKQPSFFPRLDLLLSLLLLAVTLYMTFSSQGVILRELGKALSVFAFLNLFRVLSGDAAHTKENAYENHTKNENNKADSRSV